MNRNLLIICLICFSFNSSAQWQQLDGPYGAGSSSVIRFENYLFTGTYCGDIFRSSNNGSTWNNVHDPMFYGFAEDFVIVDSLMFAAMAGRIMVSVDSGATWDSAYSTSAEVNDIAASGSKVFASTFQGCIVSYDKGQHWNSTTPGIQTLSSDMKDSLIAVGVYNGILISNDGGSIWSTLGANLGGKAILSVMITDSFIYAGTSINGMYRKRINGSVWTQINSGLNDLYINCLFQDSTRIFAGTHNGVHMSTDSGNTWTPLGIVNEQQDIISGFANDSEIVIGTRYNGVYRSTNNGLSWNEINQGVSNGSVHFFYDYQNRLFANVNYRMYFTDDNGNSWNHIIAGLPPNILAYSMIHQNNVLFAALSKGIYYSADSGITWTARDNGIDSTFNGAMDVYSIVSDGNLLFASGVTGVYTSSDSGLTWNHLTTTGIDHLNIMDTILLGWGSSLATGIQISFDHGQSWILDTNGLTLGYINFVENNAGSIYVGYLSWGLFVSHDTGLTFQQISTITSLRDLAFDNNNLYLVSQYGGLFASPDTGANWVSLQANMPIHYLNSIEFHQGYLYAGFDCDGIWSRPIPIINSVESNSISVAMELYPNPSDHEIFLKDMVNSPKQILIYNLYGQVALSEIITENKIDISILKAGVYVLSMPQENVIMKFIKL